MIYVPHTPEYASEAKRLIGQLHAFDVAARAVPYASTGNWELNTLERVSAVWLETSKAGERDGWLMDADIEVRSDPSNFFSTFLDDYNIALCHRFDKANQSDDFRVSAGVVGWRGIVGYEFFTDWASRCRSWPEFSKANHLTYSCPEQACLTFAERLAALGGAKMKSIPPKYNCLPKDEDAGVVPVLYHLPASRTKKKHIGRPA